MEEVTGPVIAISLVLCAVFVPTAFMAGISGEFYKQFALTIAGSTIISAFNSLTLSPAMCALLLKPHVHGHKQDASPRLGVAILGGLLAYVFLVAPIAHALGIEPEHGAHGPAGPMWLRISVFFGSAILGYFLSFLVNKVLGWGFGLFNTGFDIAIRGYGAVVALFLRLSVVMLLIYAGLMGLTCFALTRVPVGFIPDQDKGYLIVNVQLPDGASLERTDALVRKLARKVPGVGHTIDLAGYSTILNTNLSNSGGMFVLLKPFEERAGHAELRAPAIVRKLREEFRQFPDAQIAVFGAPPVEGLGNTGGFKLQILDRRGGGLRSLQRGVMNLQQEASQDPRLTGMLSTFSVAQPQLFVDIDRQKAKALGISLDEIHTTLQAYMGAAYVNDFTFQNRSWQVNVQADPSFRMRVEDIGRLQVRAANGERVPLQTLFLAARPTSTIRPICTKTWRLWPP